MLCAWSSVVVLLFVVETHRMPNAPAVGQTQHAPFPPNANPQPGKAEKSEAEATTEKYGLEAGLIKVMTTKDEAGAGGPTRTEQAKQLLAQYGSAYLVTSISFAIVSFAACYAAVSAGERALGGGGVWGLGGTGFVAR